MKELINRIINDYFDRVYAAQGTRHFHQEYFTDEMLEDKDLVNDIVASARELGGFRANARVKNLQ